MKKQKDIKNQIVNTLKLNKGNNFKLGRDLIHFFLCDKNVIFSIS